MMDSTTNTDGCHSAWNINSFLCLIYFYNVLELEKNSIIHSKYIYYPYVVFGTAQRHVKINSKQKIVVVIIFRL